MINWNVMATDSRVKTAFCDEKVVSEFTTDMWARVWYQSDKMPCEEGKKYRISIDSKPGNTKEKLLVNWYDETGYRKYRSYIEAEDVITAPESSVEFTIDALYHCKEDAVAILGDITYECIGNYEPKVVTMAALSNTIVEDRIQTHESTIQAYCDEIDKIVAKENPDLIVLTEHWHNMCDPVIPLDKKFVTYEHPAVTRIAEKAKKHGIYISGSWHIEEKGNRYNRCLLFDRKGEIIAEYDKIHLTIMEYEMGITPGDKSVVVDTDIGRIGVVICWDIWFPEMGQLLYKDNCDIIVNPTRGWGFPQAYAVSYVTGAYVVSAEHLKMTRIQDKSGASIDTVGDKHYAVATVDINEPHWEKCLSVGAGSGEGKNIYKYERRPDMYMPLTEEFHG